MNNIILCWPTAVVLLTFVGYASFCKIKIKQMIKKYHSCNWYFN